MSETMQMGSVQKLIDEIQILKSQILLMQAANPLWGKKYVACGDSFTQGDFSNWKDENGLSGENSAIIYDHEWKMYKTYPWWISRRNNMTLVNEAIRGTILALDKEYLAGVEGISIDRRQPFSYQRYMNIPVDTDYCTIWFGINDSVNTNLGAINDSTNETFYGAWNVVLEWLITYRPLMKIGIIITNDGAVEWREATRQCARKWGIPYLDMMGDEQVPVIFGREKELELDPRADALRKRTFLVNTENGHPNILAHEYQSYFIEDFLRRL